MEPQIDAENENWLRDSLLCDSTSSLYKMKTLRSIIKWLLLIWGAISALGVLTIVGLIAYQSLNHSGKADTKDVRFVLNWCNLGDERIEEVIKSYESARTFTGDHLDAYSIKISHVDSLELQSDDWQRVDEATGVYKEAIDFMSGWLHEIPWFPKVDGDDADKYYIYLWGIDFHGNKPVSASIILVRPEDNMIFYFESVM
jgi:hypothetical protein